MRITVACSEGLRDDAVDTFADLASLTASDLDVGDYVRVIDSGAIMQRVTSGEDFDYTGTGGVKLKALESDEGYLTAAQLGVPQDEATGADAELAAAMQTALDRQRPLHLGATKYVNGQPDLSRTLLDAVMTTGQSFRLIGGGAVVQDRIGLAEAIGKWNTSLYLYADADQVVDLIHVEGIEIDKQGGTVAVDPGGKYRFEQSHALRIYASSGGAGNALIRDVVVRDVITRGKVGAGVSFASGAIERAYVENVHGLDDDYVDNGGGTRADLEFQSSIGQLTVVGCSGQFVQSEPNVSTPFGGLKPVASFLSCNYKWFDLIGYSGAPLDQVYNLITCTNGPDGDFWVRHGWLNISDGSRLRWGGANDIRNAQIRAQDSTIVIGVDTDTNEFIPLQMTVNQLVHQHHIWRNMDFIADASASGSTTGYAVGRSTGAVPVADIDHMIFDFIDTRFDPAFQGTCDAYRSGTWTFRRSAVVSRAGGSAFTAGTTSVSYASRLTIDDCDLSGVNGYLLNVPAAPAGADWWVKFSGTMDYAKFLLTGRPVTDYQDTNIIHDAIWLADARPAGHGLNGMTVRLRTPVPGEAMEWVCTAGANSGSATFKMTRQAGIGMGGTANRPSPHADDVGLFYFDTDLGVAGRMIMWTGAAWVEAYADGDAVAAIAAKTEIAGLSGSSTAADIVAALQA